MGPNAGLASVGAKSPFDPLDPPHPLKPPLEDLQVKTDLDAAIEAEGIADDVVGGCNTRYFHGVKFFGRGARGISKPIPWYVTVGSTCCCYPLG